MRTLPPLPEDLDPVDVVQALGSVLHARRSLRLDAVAAGRLSGVCAVLEDFRDPHNAGAALRSCEAMGVQNVHLVVANQAFRTSVRVTQGCERWLDVTKHADPDRCVRALHEAGYALFAAVPEAARTVAELDPRQPLALVFGNEHLGLSPALRDRCDGEFTIPMYGASQSLNVSVSVAVSLHVVTEARRRLLGRASDLDGSELLRLRARYYWSELREPRLVVERWLRERR